MKMKYWLLLSPMSLLLWTHTVLCVSLLFLPSCHGAWLLWDTSPSRPITTRDDGGADATSKSTSRNPDYPVQLPRLSLSRRKADNRHDRHVAELLHELEEKSRISSCWKRAVGALKEKCSSLRSDDGARSRLALVMASCDSEADGGRRVWPKCAVNTEARDCVDRLDDAQYLMYIQYRLHTDVICLYIQEEAFQERTELAIQSLYASAVAASETLQALQSSGAELQMSVEKTVKQQVSNLVETQKLHGHLQDLRNGQTMAFESLRSSTEHMMHSLTDAGLSLKELHMTLDESTTQAAALVKEVAREAMEFQKRTELHANSMLNILERIETFQGKLLEKTKGLGEMVRAITLLALFVLLTIPTRTAAARLPCVGVVGSAYAFRPLLFSTTHSAMGNNIFFASVALASGIVLFFFASIYRSPEYTLRLLLRSEVRRLVDDTRSSFLEDLQHMIIETLTVTLGHMNAVNGVQHKGAEKASLLLPSQEEEKEGAYELSTHQTLLKTSGKTTQRRSRSRIR